MSFCEREGLPLENARKAFARRNMATGKDGKTARKDATSKWEGLRIQFLEGDFETLAHFARAKGLNSTTGYFAKKTKGWLAQKAEIKERTKAENVAAIAEQKGADAIAKLHSRVLQALYQALQDLEQNGAKRAEIQKGIATAKDSLELTRNVSVVIDSLLKLMPAISNIESTVAVRDLLKRFVEQDLDVTRAAVLCEEIGVALPETIRILLGKEEPPEPMDGGNEFPSDEELEQRRLEAMSKINKEISHFLPDRQKEIEELKKELEAHDSFSDDAHKS
ncbi:MAG: hypothetical protein K9M96_01815 [Deltaproteobacteria bacterium]|nr:hypothetical protein [Deltaproteobacteria bacterium]